MADPAPDTWVEVEVLKGNLVSVYRGRMATPTLEAWKAGEITKGVMALHDTYWSYDEGDGNEGWVVVRHPDPLEAQAELSRLVARLDVEIPADLQVVGDEADRTEEHVGDAARVQVGEVVEDIGPEPGLAGRRLGLVAETPFAERCALSDSCCAVP